ncbi:MAG TPA: hypothetical protein VEA61_15115 [Allosphingosinicella sp.]|nr:hypothetical protein [Allosphingosinicella sp.]
MTDDRSDPTDPASRGAMLGEAIDGAVRRITTGIVIAGAIVGLAVYARPAPPRFDAFAMGEKIVRVDMRTGTIIACEGQQTCQLILRKGQRLDRVKRTDAPAGPAALPKPPAPTLPAAAPAAGK